MGVKFVSALIKSSTAGLTLIDPQPPVMGIKSTSRRLGTLSFNDVTLKIG
jgi:hypothetical protein